MPKSPIRRIWVYIQVPNLFEGFQSQPHLPGAVEEFLIRSARQNPSKIAGGPRPVGCGDVGKREWYGLRKKLGLIL